MTATFEWALMNSALALLLAVPAYASTCLKRPALTHALWLLVLLRLVAPPMWNVSVFWPTVRETAVQIEAPQPATFVSTPIVEPEANWEIALTPESVRETQAAEFPMTAANVSPAVDWKLGIATLWVVGAVLCIGLAFLRTARFQRWVRRTPLGPSEWISDTEMVAQQMGLRRSPQVRVVEGTIAPLMWAGFGRPVLLLPARLVARIDRDRRITLIAHELAHYRRGDHFVRWLELTATAMYWWNPLVWLARRELREAEEQLCDSWVVSVLPDARRAYAAALVDTVDYLSETTSRRPALPALASGLGEVRQLKRRIVMIMSGQTPRRLRRWVMALGLGVFASALSISPSLADDEPPLPPRPPATPRAPQPPEPPGGEARARRLDPEKAEQADQIRQEMRKLRETMQRLERRLAEIEGRPAEAATAPAGRGGAAGGVMRRAPQPGGPGADATPAPGVPSRQNPPDAPGPDGPRGGRGFGGFGGAGAGPGGGFGGGPGMGGMPNLERRLEDMQRMIEQMSRELNEMRRSMRENQGPGGRGGDGGERRERRPSVSAANVVPPAPPAPPTPPAEASSPRRP